MTLPNFISLFRLLLVPIVIWSMVDGRYDFALLCFFIAGISDMLDGFLARIMKATSDLGRFLDPLADKMLLVAVFVTLGFQGYFPSWLVILVVFRDFLILLGVLLSKLFERNIEMKPLFISKANTLVQLLAVGLILIQLSIGQLYPTFNTFLFILTACFTFLSGAGYVKKWIQGTKEDPL